VTHALQRTQLRLLWLRGSYVLFALALLVVLLVVNVVINPARFTPSSLGVTVGLAAPLILAAVASTPSILSGRGGIDLSIGPLMGLVNVVIVHFVIGSLGQASPWIVVPISVLVGLLGGLVNGFLVVVARIQPIVATLGTYLVFAGLSTWLLPEPGGSIPPWLSSLAGDWSLVPILVVLVCWLVFLRLPIHNQLMATGDDDRAALSSGVRVNVVRLAAYVLGGALAGVAALSLTALIGSADPTVGSTFTLTAIAAVALGGVSLAGGVGGISGAIVGAVDIFLLQSLLTYFNVSSFVLQVAYGLILVMAVVLNTTVGRSLDRRILRRTA
jgi:ribose transport system permease protein